MALGFAFAIAIISSIGFFSYQSINRFLRAADLVTHTNEVIAHIENLKKECKY